MTTGTGTGQEYTKRKIVLQMNSKGPLSRERLCTKWMLLQERKIRVLERTNRQNWPYCATLHTLPILVSKDGRKQKMARKSVSRWKCFFSQTMETGVRTLAEWPKRR